MEREPIMKNYPEIDQNDLNEININKLQNINYINSITLNNVLHLISLSKPIYVNLKPKYIKILENKSIDINATNLEGKTCLMTGVIRMNYDFVIYALENCDDINLNIKDSNDNTLFYYACLRCNFDIITKLLEKGCKYTKNDIAKIADDNIREKLTKILYGDDVIIEYNSSNIDILPEDSEFKLYSEDDFYFDQKDKIGSGAYGTAMVVVEKATGKKCVIKKFLVNPIKNLFLEESVLRDIMYLRELKKKKHTVQIYGIIIDKNNYIYMVMEFLNLTVDQYIRQIEKKQIAREKKIEYYKKLMYEILICIDNNSKAGIIHGDTKSNNIMLNDQGVAKYIDYGFSIYNGISPLRINIDYPIHVGSYLPRDGSEEHTLINVFVNNKREFAYVSGYFGYKVDIASLGLMFIHQVVGYNGIERCAYYKDNLYKKFTQNNRQEMHCEPFPEGINYLKERYGEELMTLILNMIELDPSNRKTAKEILRSPIFENKPYVFPKIPNITVLENFNEYDYLYSLHLDDKNIPIPKNVETNIIKTAFDDYNVFNLYNYKNIGFVYFDDILNYWKDKKVRLVKVNYQQFESVMLLLIDFVKESKVCIDALFNTIFYIYNCIYRSENGLPTPFSVHDFCFNKMLPYTILISYSNVYQNSFIKETDFFKNLNDIYKYNKLPLISPEQKTSFTYEIKKINERLKRDTEFFKLYPVMSFINYIKFFLQLICKYEDKITTLICQTIDFFKCFIFGEHQIEDGEYNVFELVKYCYYKTEKPIDIQLRSSIKLD